MCSVRTVAIFFLSSHQTIKKYSKMKKIFLAIISTFLVSAGSAQVVRPASWSTAGNSVNGTTNAFLGTTNAYPLVFKTFDSTRMFISTTGNVGFNTELPQQMLHVVDGNILISKTSTGAKAPGSPNGSILFGKNATNTNPYGSWGIEYLDDDSDGHGLNFWKPYTSSGNYGNYFLFLHDNGNVGVGTKNPQEKLSVNGGVLARSVRVRADAASWPDYVFAPGYKLMSIEELEMYVNTHRHLPGIPSAKEIGEKDAVDLQEMNMLLLQKIEELTKYVIDLQNQIDELKEGKEREK